LRLLDGLEAVAGGDDVVGALLQDHLLHEEGGPRIVYEQDLLPAHRTANRAARSAATAMKPISPMSAGSRFDMGARHSSPCATRRRAARRPKRARSIHVAIALMYPRGECTPRGRPVSEPAVQESDGTSGGTGARVTA